MSQLQDNLPLRFVNRLRQLRKILNKLVAVNRQLPGGSHTVRLHKGKSRNNQAHASGGMFNQDIDVPLGAESPVICKSVPGCREHEPVRK